jgi:uncharacterized protein YukE
VTADELAAMKDELQKAIYSGVLEVRFQDRLIKYQTTTEMRRALSDLNSTIDTGGDSGGSGTGSRSMSNFARFNG